MREHARSRLGQYPFRCTKCGTRFSVQVENGAESVWQVVQSACVTGAFVMAALAAILVLMFASNDAVKNNLGLGQPGSPVSPPENTSFVR